MVDGATTYCRATAALDVPLLWRAPVLPTSPRSRSTLTDGYVVAVRVLFRQPRAARLGGRLTWAGCGALFKAAVRNDTTWSGVVDGRAVTSVDRHCRTSSIAFSTRAEMPTADHRGRCPLEPGSAALAAHGGQRVAPTLTHLLSAAGGGARCLPTAGLRCCRRSLTRALSGAALRWTSPTPGAARRRASHARHQECDDQLAAPVAVRGGRERPGAAGIRLSAPLGNVP